MPGPKVWISVDMEGIGGLVDRKQFLPEDREYERSRPHMIREMRTVVEAAWSAGASRVLVNDSHDGQLNLAFDALEGLPPATELISGSGKRLQMGEGLPGHDVAMFIGYHAKAGTAGAIMDHTYTGDVHHVALNGQEVGECGLNAYLAGHFGIPVGVVSGDQALYDEARPYLPETEFVVTKWALGRKSARVKHPDVVHRELRDAVVRAVERMARGEGPKPLRIETPVTLELGFVTSQGTDLAMLYPGAERIDGRTVAVECPDMEAAYLAFRALLRLGTGFALY
jgi:D-amino peptidase